MRHCNIAHIALQKRLYWRAKEALLHANIASFRNPPCAARPAMQAVTRPGHSRKSVSPPLSLVVGGVRVVGAHATPEDKGIHGGVVAVLDDKLGLDERLGQHEPLLYVQQRASGGGIGLFHCREFLD